MSVSMVKAYVRPTITDRVKINRTYVSARNGDIVEAVSREGWDQLSELVSRDAVVVEDFAAPDGTDGMVVACATSRGRGGAYAVHDLACRYGAPAVILLP